MKKYLAILKRTKLFSGIGEDEIEEMLSCLNAKKLELKKGDYAYRAGEHLHCVPLLVEGRLHIQKDDFWGNRSIINVIGVGELFGESYIAPHSGPLLNDVVAAEDSIVICLDANRVITTCSNACRFHQLVVRNLFFEVSERNRKLVQKLGHMAQRTTREKLISYLSEQSKRQGSASFEIPLNRQQLADFLSVDRSAMSNELCKMRDQGLLRFDKNSFELLQDERNI